jgi:prevent-host-death family protein
MERIGIRELKENMSRYMKKVRTGERIIVTDRKNDIAIIMPIGIKLEKRNSINSSSMAWPPGPVACRRAWLSGLFQKGRAYPALLLRTGDDSISGYQQPCEIIWQLSPA